MQLHRRSGCDRRGAEPDRAHVGRHRPRDERSGPGDDPAPDDDEHDDVHLHDEHHVDDHDDVIDHDDDVAATADDVL